MHGQRVTMNDGNNMGQNSSSKEPDQSATEEPDPSLLRYIDSMGSNDPTDPYPAELDSLPYPPTGAREIQPEGTTGQNSDDAVFRENEGAEVHARCTWSGSSLTVTWRGLNPGARTFVQLGVGFLDDPDSECWYPLGVLSQDEQTRQVDAMALGPKSADKTWWWLINFGEGSTSDVDP